MEPNELRCRFVKNPYAWPGGYPLFALTDDGGSLCKDCCKSEKDLIDGSTHGDGWHITGLCINYEDQNLICDHCNKQIEVAYPEQEEL